MDETRVCGERDVYEKRPIHMKRNLYTWNETYLHGNKTRVCGERDVYEKRRIHMKRDLNTWNET